MRQRKTGIVLTSILLLFAACKGESPTAPPVTGTLPNGGGTTPPAGVSLTITTSNENPLVDSKSIITATVKDANGNPVPNGTAVEFVATGLQGAVFEDTGTAATIRTTTNGVASATLTSTTAGSTHVTVTVNNVTRAVDITFKTKPIEQQPPSTAPTITSVTPTLGRPSGGEQITITGTNFTEPVRVLFDVGRATPVEAFVTSVTPTTITAITPAVDLGAGQELAATVKVITRAGTASEQATTAVPFTFRNTVLTPIVYTVTPNSGPINGGTRVTIFGEGFQDPVQVLFGTAEARVIDVKFGQILVEAPDGRSTSPNGSGPVTGPVNVTVVNVTANKRSTLEAAFAYKSKMQITTVQPLTGSALGGTDVTIDGVGFDQPLLVTFNGVPATVLSVSGTRIRARTGPAPFPCAPPVTSPSIFVTNTDNGDTDAWGDDPNEISQFAYIPVRAQIVSTTSPVAPGGTLTVSVENPGVGALGTANVRFSLGGTTLIPSPATINSGTGTQTFTIAVPTSGFTFPTVACTTSGGAPGTQLGNASLPLSFSNITTLCAGDTVTVVVTPPGPNACTQAPPQAAVTTPANGACANAVATIGSSSTTNIIVRNNATAGGQTLTVTPGAISGADAAQFTIAPTTQQSAAPGGTSTFTVTFTPTGTAGSRTASVNFTTNDPLNPTLPVCITGTANPPAP
ncbi:MAG TPA: IPT/TIG domain-containing protein [Thermoanaerobaculia bacterium]